MDKEEIISILRYMKDQVLDMYIKSDDQSTKDWCEGKMSAFRDCIEVIKSPVLFNNK